MGKIKDKAGQRFGMLLVQELAGTDRFNIAQWRCICDCGQSTTVSSNALSQGRTRSCGCRMGMAPADIAGQRFGKLVALRPVGKKPRVGIVWECLCDCGNTKQAVATVLRKERVVSCGCAVSDKVVYWSKGRRAEQAVQTSRRRARKANAAGAFTRKQVDALYLKQRGRCANCHCALGDKFHRDHRVALANGGTNDISNIELLCGLCNNRKHVKDPIAWAQENGRLI